jgi:para-aminobenzoate synthetase component 1
VRPPAHTELSLRELPAAVGSLRAFEALRGHGLAWLLDSALPSRRLGRFSCAGADPYLVLRARGEDLCAEVRRPAVPGLACGRRRFRGDLLEAARGLLPRLPTDAAPALPFVGGAVAALGYELGQAWLPVRLDARDELGLPDATLLFVDRLLVWDHEQGRLFAAGLGFGEDAGAARSRAEAAACAAAAWLEGAGGERSVPASALAPATSGGFDEGSYAKAVETVKEEIAAGNVYQANLTHRIARGFRGDPWRLYCALRRHNPAPFACYLELPDATLLSSSPERFLRVGRDGSVESRPIKGTRPRGRHAEEDRALRQALADSSKDRAENLMIVDLVRNDLGRVCETGSIEVPEVFAVEEYAAVFQLVSTVTGRLRAGRDAFDCVRAAFPPGSMTGAPKIAAMRLLARLEPVRRGAYSGAVGYFDARGGADLSVVIRTLVLSRGRAHVHTGGGVVADSDPRGEWRETLDKARPLLAALDEAAAAP